MWGGVKHRRHYGDLFRNWSATKGLESLRSSQYAEPRPWYLAFSLHQHRHLLQDYHCARLLGWCTTVLQVRTDAASKREAYRYAHETLHMLAHSHKVGKETLLQCMRLCLVGRDLTSAFNWYQYWIESQNDGAGTLWPLVWLLRIAYDSPSDESAEDMAVAVRDAYLARLGVKDGASQSSYPSFMPESQDEADQWVAFGMAFWALRPRLRDQSVLRFVDSLPVAADPAADVAVRSWLQRGVPQPSPHHVFPSLEQGIVTHSRPPSVARPYLRDSLLHGDFVKKLEAAAFESRDAKAVVGLLQQYKDEVAAEQQRRERTSERRSEIDLWRQYADPCAQRFRHPLVEQGGLTPELYHYLIAALAISHPSAALRTIQRMREANLRVLDLTRAVALVASSGAADEQLRLFKEQLEEVESRKRLDADYDICKAVEHYWKFEYTNFFHYRNALDEEEFYHFILDSLGPAAVQRLVLDSQVCGPTATTEDLVVLNEPWRRAVAAYFRGQLGETAVEAAMNAITRHVPKLDISLVNSVPHFTDYTLADTDAITTDLPSLRDRLTGVHTVYILDTSFVESSESFLSIGTGVPQGVDDSAGSEASSSLVLVPFVVLQQLAVSVAQSHTFVTFDPSLQDGLREEPLLASQRLRALAAMTMRSVNGHKDEADRGGLNCGPSRESRVLHFSECLLAHAMTPLLAASEVEDEQVHTGDVAAPVGTPTAATDDNEHLLLVVGMVRALCAPSVRVVLCTDDPSLQQRVQSVASSSRPGFAGPIQILSTQPPEQVVETDQVGGLVNDNPLFAMMDMEDFQPKLSTSSAASGHIPRSAQVSAAAHRPGSGSGDDTAASAKDVVPALMEQTDDEPLSPWLSLLDDTTEDVTPVETTAASSPDVVSVPEDHAIPAAVNSNEEDEAQHNDMEKLMNLYESPHDVVPVGAKMMQASQLGTVFDEFDSVDPFERTMAAEERAARRSRLQAQGGGDKPRRASALEKEFLQNRGASNKQRYQLARSMSNQSGGRVPFHFRYKVVEADINDPKNASLRRSYEAGLQRKRDHFKRTNQR